MKNKKQLILAFLMVAIGSLVHAQTNLDFETWVSTMNGTKPAGWVTFDDNLPSSADESVREITGGAQSEGQSSARLITVDFNGNPIPGQLVQTAAYSQQPDLFSFDLKYNVKANDTSSVLMILTANNQPVGFSQTRIVGPGADQNWQNVVRSVRYFDTTTTPDSVTFRISSSGNVARKVGSELSIDDISFCPNGARDSTVTFCNDNSKLDLVSQLAGLRIRGSVASWIDVDNSGALNGDTLDLAQMSGGQYEFKYVVNLSACSPDTATLTFNLIDAPAAGEGDSVLACANDTVDLFNQLDGNPDTGGSWTDLDGTGALSNGMLDASMLNLGSTYAFKYTNSDSGCMDSAILHVTVNQSDAGVNATVKTCENNTTYDLISNLGGSPDQGGNWIDTDNTGALNDSTVDLTQLPIDSSFQFTYIVSSNGCEPDTSVLTLETEEPLIPGESNSVNLCYNDTINLFNVLGGSPDRGGTWADVDNTGALEDSLVIAGNVPQDSMAYDFVYILESSQSNCQVSSTATVFITQEPNAGENTFGGVVCENETNVKLVNLLNGNPVSTGTWSDDDNTGALDQSTGTIDASLLAADSSYIFTYKVTDTCGPNDSAELTVNVEGAPNAGENSDTLTVCNTKNDIDLFAQLNGNPDEGGDWTEVTNSGGHTNGTFDATQISDSGVFVFRYRINGNQCENDDAFVTVKVEDCNGDFIQSAVNKIKLNVYPNPAQEQISFETSDDAADEIRIYDIRGMVVHKKAFDSEKVNVKVDDWSKGLYIYHITDENGAILSVDRFVVE